MTVKDLIQVYNASFDVVVKEKGECFSYKCKSTNVTQYSDFCDREVYKIDDDMQRVWCW